MYFTGVSSQIKHQQDAVLCQIGWLSDRSIDWSIGYELFILLDSTDVAFS